MQVSGQAAQGVAADTVPARFHVVAAAAVVLSPLAGSAGSVARFLPTAQLSGRVVPVQAGCFVQTAVVAVLCYVQHIAAGGLMAADCCLWE